MMCPSCFCKLLLSLLLCMRGVASADETRQKIDPSAKTACNSSIIFSDDFANINLTVWQYNTSIGFNTMIIKAEDKPPRENIFVKDGALHIQPVILSEEYRRDKILDPKRISRCKESPIDDECRRGTKYFYVPSDQSGHVTTRQKFSLQYGLIEAQVKFPAADWIAPEIRLVPSDHTHVSALTGLVRVVLKKYRNVKSEDGHDVRRRILEGSVLVEHGAEVESKSVYFTNKSNWQTDFHNLTILWTPDDVLFMVDGKQRQTVKLSGLNVTDFSDAVVTSNPGKKLWNTGGSITLSDRPFHVRLGITVGNSRDYSWPSSNPRV
ncbi:unnamed protein product [Bemisia tabaci]|uniref:GH16 domain-containing protein n=1 Tax=Bemisia tabaci TaxID=7038 RepID=A0A9P0C8W7_BEMTA|nr:unnamed protein product [Bemisia tabaci]